MAGRARSVLERILGAAAIAVVAWAMSPARAQTEVHEATITGFSIPEVDEEGQIRWKVMGDSARFKPAGPVHIEGVRLELYKDEKVDMVLTAPHCTYDREKQEATTDSPVRIEGHNVLVTGTGFFWSGTNNLVVIRKNARVILSDIGLVSPKAGNSSTDKEHSR